MHTLARIVRRVAVAAVTAGPALAGTGAAHAATVPPPGVADHTVTAEIRDPIPNSLRPTVLGQTCSGALVPLHAIPGLVGPLLDGGTLGIVETLLGNDAVTMLHLPGSPLAIATLPGRAGTLVANNVGNDFYATAVLCNGGGAPLEPHLFLTQVGNPLGAVTGSVTGSVEDSGSSVGSGDGGSIDVSSVTGSVDISSTEGSVDSSAVGSGSIPGSSEGSDIRSGAGSLGSLGSDLSSASSHPGSNDGSSIDVGSIIPLAGDIGDSVGGIGFPGS